MNLFAQATQAQKYIRLLDMHVILGTGTLIIGKSLVLVTFETK